jgi:hypothetical protein
MKVTPEVTMDLTIITVLKSGQHLTYSKAGADVRLLLESRGRRITLQRRRPPSDSTVRGDAVSEVADNLALDHMAARRREHEVDKFIVVRGSVVTELDAESMSLPSGVA